MENAGLIITFLLAAVLLVPLFQRLKLGSVLGYLAAGLLIGPSGFHLVKDGESILHLAEFGVVFLMFIIGLELQLSRLWTLRKSIFGLGLYQMMATTVILYTVLRITGEPPGGALLLAMVGSLSSTAIVLQSLSERSQIVTAHGRDAFSILLFQDLAVIPMLALLPMVSLMGQESTESLWSRINYQSIGLSLLAILITIVGGRLLLRPILQRSARSEAREVFTATCLLIVVGISILFDRLGLSMGLGAFLAGILLADSEYRHEIEANIEPFKGLLLGLFFIAIGLTAKLDLFLNAPLQILGWVTLMYVIKFLVVYVWQGWIQKQNESGRKLSIFLSPGGEFGFVILSAAALSGLIPAESKDFGTIVITVSMLLAPLLFLLEDHVLSRKLDKKVVREFDKIDDIESSVIIAGFGRFGQIVARLLNVRKIKFTALDKNPQQVDFVRKFGSEIFYGDASKLELLHAAKAHKAKVFILAIDDVESSIKTAEIVRHNFPHLKIVARARNRFHMYKLLDLGISPIYRETLLSSLEAGSETLRIMGFSRQQSEDTVRAFQKYDEDLVLKQHAVYQDEKLLVQTSMQALADLEGLFENDAQTKELSEVALAPAPDQPDPV